MINQRKANIVDMADALLQSMARLASDTTTQDVLCLVRRVYYDPDIVRSRWSLLGNSVVPYDLTTRSSDQFFGNSKPK